jgi:hypothetical protein
VLDEQEGNVEPAQLLLERGLFQGLLGQDRREVGARGGGEDALEIAVGDGVGAISRTLFLGLLGSRPLRVSDRGRSVVDRRVRELRGPVMGLAVRRASR